MVCCGYRLMHVDVCLMESLLLLDEVECTHIWTVGVIMFVFWVRMYHCSVPRAIYKWT